MAASENQKLAEARQKCLEYGNAVKSEDLSRANQLADEVYKLSSGILKLQKFGPINCT